MIQREGGNRRSGMPTLANPAKKSVVPGGSVWDRLEETDE